MKRPVNSIQTVKKAAMFVRVVKFLLFLLNYVPFKLLLRVILIPWVKGERTFFIICVQSEDYYNFFMKTLKAIDCFLAVIFLDKKL